MTVLKIWGAAFRPSATFLGGQQSPQVRLLKDGSFVSVWESSYTAGDPGWGESIRGQIFNADGTKRGSEFLVSASSDAFEEEGSTTITVLKDGRFVVAWDTIFGEDLDLREANARVFQANGDPAGEAFRVNSSAHNWAAFPALTSLSDGGFAVAYDVGGGQIETQVFGASLKRVGGEETINKSTSNASLSTSLVSLQDKYMAFFEDVRDNRLFGRILNNDGSIPATSTDFLVSTTGYDNSAPVAAKLADGRIVVAWVNHTKGAAGADIAVIKAQILNADGSKSGNELLLSAQGLSGCSAAVIDASIDGGFIIGYSNRLLEGSPQSVRVAAFDENGVRAAEDLLIGAGQSIGGITTLADGRVIVTWDKYTKGGRGFDVYAQAVDPRQKAVELAGTHYKDQFFGTRFDDKISGGSGSDQLSGGAGNDTLTGGTGHDILKGSSGNDKISGGVGNDSLYGGTGGDVFVFDTRPNTKTNVDKIYDFRSKSDTFWLDSAIFTKLGRGTDTGVKFKSDMFVKSNKAKDREDRIIYDKETGNLYYDPDGTGAKSQVKIATLTNKTKLAYHDFFVI